MVLADLAGERRAEPAGRSGGQVPVGTAPGGPGDRDAGQHRPPSGVGQLDWQQAAGFGTLQRGHREQAGIEPPAQVRERVGGNLFAHLAQLQAEQAVAGAAQQHDGLAAAGRRRDRQPFTIDQEQRARGRPAGCGRRAGPGSRRAGPGRDSRVRSGRDRGGHGVRDGGSGRGGLPGGGRRQLGSGHSQDGSGCGAKPGAGNSPLLTITMHAVSRGSGDVPQSGPARRGSDRPGPAADCCPTEQMRGTS